MAITQAAVGGASDTVCIPEERSLPDGPFTSLRYHFGMLLGVDDFTTEQRYHREKMRLHNAWLHRAGIVWGLAVDAALDKRELRVAPGLALDPTGRELHLDVTCCMDIGAWYDENKDEVQVMQVEVGGTPAIRFDGRVEIAFCSCGTRPVPAISGPCEGAEVDTAYSRTFETVSIRFVPEPATPEPPPYPRLRLLFGIDDGAASELTQEERDAIGQARTDVLASGTWSQTLLEKFRQFADADAVAMTPASPPDGTPTVFPALDDAPVVLADVREITLQGSTGNWTLVGATIDPTPRRVHVATQTIEELLCGDLRPAGAATGPQVAAIQVDRQAKTISITLDKPVDPHSVEAASFSVTQLRSTGWKAIGVKKPTLSANGTQIDLALNSSPGTNLLRLVAYGTGPTPIVGADPPVPLAGAVGDPPGPGDGGRDYVSTSTPTS